MVKRKMTEAEMYERSFMRPKNYFKLSPEDQWHIDEKLGILNWEGKNLTPRQLKRFRDHYKDGSDK